jgi:hypothetical protein
MVNLYDSFRDSPNPRLPPGHRANAPKLVAGRIFAMMSAVGSGLLLIFRWRKDFSDLLRPFRKGEPESPLPPFFRARVILRVEIGNRFALVLLITIELIYKKELVSQLTRR